MAREQKRNDIITPCPEEVQRYLDKWKGRDNKHYVIQEDALDDLFLKTYPQNTDIKQVIIKVSALNDFYSTNIFKVYDVADNIVNLKIDNRIASKDFTLVKDIANVRVSKQTDESEEKIINFYSFATKYCSRHNPIEYPIYDYYVDRILRYFRNTDEKIDFKNEELKDYTKYRDIIFEFRKQYGLEQFNLKKIDRYLWQLGKEKFPKNYGIKTIDKHNE